MKVYKFGGASIKNAKAIQKMVKIVEKAKEDLIIVVSAMGKSTNKLEVITRQYFENKNFTNELLELKEYHYEVVRELFGEIPFTLELIFASLEQKLNITPSLDYDFEYDQIVSNGELLSTTIIAALKDQD